MILVTLKSDFSDSQFLEKMQKQIRKLPKPFANCELWTANSNPDFAPSSTGSIVDFEQVSVSWVWMLFYEAWI